MLALVLSLLLPLVAQNAPAQPAPAAPAAPAPAPAPAPAKAEPYTYSPEGRRDPFLSLVGVGTDARTARKGDGPANMAVADVLVRGVMQSRGALIAMVEGPDKKTYIVHQGDKFVDGTIKSITTTGLVIVQQVNDPLSLVKQREIVKLLHSLEGGKE